MPTLETGYVLIGVVTKKPKPSLMKRLLWISVLIALIPSTRELYAQQKLYGVTREGGRYGGGTLFAIDTTGQNYTKLRDFSQPEHSPDNNEVIEGPDGYLYGTVASGGMHNTGALFKVKKDGTDYTVVYAFDGTTAKNPSGHLALTGGYLYGTARAGGDNNFGAIFKVKTDGTDYNALYSFATNTGTVPQSGVLLGSNGNLYGVTQEGGSALQGTIFSIDPDGANFVSLHSFDIPEGALPYGGLYQASDNALYGMASTREQPGKGFIYSINPDGSNYRTVYTFGIEADPRGTLTQLTDGYLYGITSKFIFRIKPDGTDYTNLKTFDGNNGITGIGKLVLATNGYLYGVTSEGGQLNEGVVFRLKPDGTDYTSVWSFTSGGLSPTGNVLLSGTTLYGMTSRGGAGYSGVLYKFEISNSQVTTLHDFYSSDPNGQTPVHIITGPDNTLYGITNEGGVDNNGILFKVKADGSGYTVLYSFAFRGDDGASPNGLFYASNGYLYGTTYVGGVADNGTLFRIKPDGSDFEQLQAWNGSSGAKPTGGMVEWRNELWIMTEEGGEDDAGTIYAVPLDGDDVHSVYEFKPSNGADGRQPTGRLIAATDGNLYGLTRAGGANGQGAFFRLTSPDGAPETLFSFSINVGYYPTGSLVETPDGDLNGTTTIGALNGAGELFRINKDGTNYRSLYPFFDPPANGTVDQLITSSTGKLFGATAIGELNQGYGELYTTNISGGNPHPIYDFDFTTGSTPVAITLAGAGANPELDVTIDGVAATTPGKKDFGTISVLTSSAATTVTLKNSGAASLVLKDPKVSITGATADFTIDQSTLPTTIEPGSSGSFKVTFKPQTTGSKTAKLSISTNDIDEGTFIIDLTGSAIKQGQTITFNTPPAKTYGDAAFTLQATSSANLPITFTSANTDIASIDGSILTIKQAGSVEITASQAGNDNVSAAASVKRTLVINKATQTITFDTPPAQTFGAADITLPANSSAGLPLTYTSAKPDIAAINGNTVTIKKAGTVDITATQTGNSNVLAATSVKRTLVINKAQQFIEFPVLPNKKTGDAPFTLNATVTSNLPIVYTSSNTAVATISGNTVTIIGAGKTNITASQPGNENYQAAATIQQPLTISDVEIAMTLSPASLDFGDVVLGESVNKTITISNTGQGSLEISSIILPDGFKRNDDTDIYYITGGTGVTITITFTPENAIAYNGQIDIRSNATTEQHTIAVTGKGVPVTAITDPAIPAPYIYPNPGTGIYTITTTQALTTQNTQLLSSQGSIVNTTLQRTQPNTYLLDLTSNSAGIYLLLIQTDSNTQTYRIIKQ